ncbi:MAG: hypothetical protein PUD72_06265 [Oscillospiraceae bacterium]|nr:hypothetical protein [Oscillospiraceae bacterium]
MEKIRSFAKSQYIEKAELVFKFCYLCLVLLSFNTFSARQWYLFYISIFVVLFGFVLGILRLTHIKDYLTKNILVLVLFVVSYLVSSLTVIRYGFTENIQAIAWMCIQFFLLFAYDKTRENESVLDELKVYFNFFVAYTGLMALIGLVMMLFNWNTYRVVDNMYVIAGGFLWNRLWGCYIDPNYGAVFAIISIIISMYLWENSSNVKKYF